MITIDKISTPNYTLMIRGNGGEELLVLLYCGDVLISTVSAGCAAPHIFYQGPIDNARLRALLVQWTHHGIPPTDAEEKVLTRRIDQVIHKFNTLFA